MDFILKRPWVIALSIALFMACLIPICNWSVGRQEERIREYHRTEAVLKGRQAKENGQGFQTNPYLQNEYRELWRKGWREAKEVKE
jgi:ribosome modulation factor